MAGNKITVEIDRNNLRDIELMFKQLPKQVDQNKIWVKFWRETSKPLVKEARNNANALGGTGQLAKSVGFFTTKASRKYNGGYVGPKVRGAFKSKEKSGYYGAWVEYGGEVNFGGKGTGSNQPWMENAFNAKKNIVLANGMKDAEKIFGRALKTHERRLKKYGTLGY
tara:strand:- start:5734 stop:6234 length:501 start_codon:yes stop_codon:yes gene_type:complete